MLQELSRRGQLSIPTKRRRPVADLADEVERRVTGHPIASDAWCQEAPHPVDAGCGCLGAWVGNRGVWTVSTLWVSDWAVPVPDWAGFRMFPGVASVCKGWNPVRVPPRARIIPRQRGFCFNVWTLTLRGAL